MKHPWLFPISILIFSTINLWAYLHFRYEKQDRDKSTTLLANTELISALPEYKKAKTRYRRLLICDAFFFTLALISVTALAAQPLGVVTKIDNYEDQDLMLCINLDDIKNKTEREIFTSLKEQIPSLRGQRVGLTIFNDSSYRLMPLSADYVGLRERADSFLKNSEEYNDFVRVDTSKSQENAHSIGENIISCVNNFDGLDDSDRVRSMLYIGKAKKPSVHSDTSVTQAADYAKLKNIRFYTLNIHPNSNGDFEEVQERLRRGDESLQELQFYRASSDGQGDYHLFCEDGEYNNCPLDKENISSFITKITERENSVGEELAIIKRQDSPLRFSLIMLGCIILCLILSWRLKI